MESLADWKCISWNILIQTSTGALAFIAFEPVSGFQNKENKVVEEHLTTRQLCDLDQPLCTQGSPTRGSVGLVQYQVLWLSFSTFQWYNLNSN